MKKYIYATLFAASLLITACDDKKDSNHSNSTENSTKEASKEGIKVTKNAIKADEKADKGKENSGQFYYSYNKKKNSNENNESETYRTTLDAYLNIRSPYERIKINLMISKLSHDFMVFCSACHNDYGNGIIGPSLLGKDSDYIYSKIMDFKSGKKDNVLMKALVKQIDDERLKSISVEIAEFNKKLLKLRNEK